MIVYRTIEIQSVKVAYREAGDPGKPTLLLLHGFPTASHMFRDLIPKIEDHFHLIAPDLPGFGQSDIPRERFNLTFTGLTDIMEGFVHALGLDKFAIYIFDYGAPVGLRLALRCSESITAIITQNGNAYEEGLSSGWDSMKAFWAKPTTEYRESLRAAFSADAIRGQYTTGVPDASLVSPDGWTLDAHYLERPGAHEAQLDLFQDYGSNVALYPSFQQYLRQRQPPLLAVWGKNDPYFLPAGAHAFKRDLPNATVVLFETGHFALETHSDEIAKNLVEFFNQQVVSIHPRG
jgi:pimeloyl-ACP methyl ester carboxylesterase